MLVERCYNRQMVSDHLIRAVVRESGLRISSVISTLVVTEAAARHGTSRVATVALGRGLTSGLLLATMTKGPERVTVQLQGDGPLGAITVDANDTGEVRGYVRNVDVETNQPRARFRLAEAMGRNGVVNVTRDLGLRELYQGQTAIVTGEIDEDVEAYLRESEQVPSALGCEVVVDEDGAMIAAGGVLLQTLPGGEADLVRPLQHALRTGALFDALKSGELTAEELARRLLPDMAIDVLGAERSVRFQCRCSDERIRSVLHLMSITDLDEMIAEQKPAEVTCNFCNQKFSVPPSEIEKIRAEVAGGPRTNN